MINKSKWPNGPRIPQMEWSAFRIDANLFLGYIPDFLSEDDPRDAVTQLDAGYQHGGGWQDFNGFTMIDGELRYPGDPPLWPIAMTRLRNEVIRVYAHGWVSVTQPDGTFRVARMD